MKVQVLQENFARALTLCNHFVSSRAQLPVLANTALVASKTKLQIKATNLEISLSTAIGAKSEREGSITVPAKTLSDIINQLPKQAISLEADAEILKISTENFNGKLSGISINEFPQIPSNIEGEKISFKKNELLTSLSQVLFSASSDEARPILTGVLCTKVDEQLVLVGTDGFRLSQKRIDIKKAGNLAKAIIPKTALAALSRIASDEEEISVQIKESENQVLFQSGESVLSSRIIQGEFPPFEKIIPKETRVKVSLDRVEFLRAVKLASVFARDGGFIGTFKITKDGLTIFAESSRSGSQEMQVEARVEGEPLEILYNLHFVEEFLGVASGESIEMNLTDPSAPGVFKDLKDSNFLHLIMPVKLN